MINIAGSVKYKIIRSRIFWYALFCYILLLIGTGMPKLFFSEITLHGKDTLPMLGTEFIIYNIAFLVFFVGLIIGSDYSNKTINYEVMSGHSRKDMIMGRLMVLAPLSVIFVLIINGSVVLISTLKNGWGARIDGKVIAYLVGHISLMGLIYLEISILVLMLTFVFQNAGAAIVASIILFFAEVVATSIFRDININFVKSVIDLLSTNQLQNLYSGSLTKELVFQIIISKIIMITILFRFGVLITNKCDMK